LSHFAGFERYLVHKNNESRRAFDEWAALQTDPRITDWGRRVLEARPAAWPAGAPSNEEHRAVTAWPQK
jgi:hypothetical protein